MKWHGVLALLLVGTLLGACQLTRTPSCPSSVELEASAEIQAYHVANDKVIVTGSASLRRATGPKTIDLAILGVRVGGVPATQTSAGFIGWSAELPLQMLRTDRLVQLEVEYTCGVKHIEKKEVLQINLPEGTGPVGLLDIRLQSGTCFLPVLGGQAIEVHLSSTDANDDGLLVSLTAGKGQQLSPPSIRLIREAMRATGKALLSVQDINESLQGATVFASAGPIPASGSPLSLPIEAGPTIDGGETALPKTASRKVEVRSQGNRLTCTVRSSDSETSTAEVLRDGAWDRVEGAVERGNGIMCGATAKLRLHFSADSQVGANLRLRCEDQFGQVGEATWTATAETAGEVNDLSITQGPPDDDCYFPRDGSAWGRVMVRAENEAADLTVELRPTGVEFASGTGPTSIELVGGSSEAVASAAVRIAQTSEYPTSIVTVLAGPSSDTTRLRVAGPPTFVSPSLYVPVGTEFPLRVHTDGRLRSCEIESADPGELLVLRGDTSVSGWVEFSADEGSGQLQDFTVRALSTAVLGAAVVINCHDTIGQSTSITLTTAAVPTGGD